MDAYPYAWLFFVPFIVATSFAILNLFIGIIVDSMQIAQPAEASATADGGGDDGAVLAEVRALRDEVASLRCLLEADRRARGSDGDAAG